mgnify:CR=1 FL=1
MNFSKNQVNAISNLGLAHIGDGVFELLTRSWLCGHERLTVGRMHKDTISMVQAKAQAKFADKLIPLLTEDEKIDIAAARILNRFRPAFEELAK